MNIINNEHFTVLVYMMENLADLTLAISVHFGFSNEILNVHPFGLILGMASWGLISSVEVSGYGWHGAV